MRCFTEGYAKISTSPRAGSSSSFVFNITSVGAGINLVVRHHTPPDRIIEYPELDGTHKDYRVHPPAPHCTTQTLRRGAVSEGSLSSAAPAPVPIPPPSGGQGGVAAMCTSGYSNPVSLINLWPLMVNPRHGSITAEQQPSIRAQLSACCSPSDFNRSPRGAPPLRAAPPSAPRCPRNTRWAPSPQAALTFKTISAHP